MGPSFDHFKKNLGKRNKENIIVIFDQWPKLHTNSLLNMNFTNSNFTKTRFQNSLTPCVSVSEPILFWSNIYYTICIFTKYGYYEYFSGPKVALCKDSVYLGWNVEADIQILNGFYCCCLQQLKTFEKHARSCHLETKYLLPLWKFEF